MIEYLRHIEEYSNYWFGDFSKLTPADKWGDKQVAEKYLQKYWLPDHEYQSQWRPIEEMIFNHGKGLPDLAFKPTFNMLALRGGGLFEEQDFKQLQKTIRELGEDHIVIIQRSQGFTEGEPVFRMKFPSEISWEELVSGNFISAVLLEMHYNEYYVFGESGTWGKYAANDYDYPMDILGFKPEVSPIFMEEFKQPREEWEEIQGWLPEEYKGRTL